MSTPDKCPKCGSGETQTVYSVSRFFCGSMSWSDGTFDQSIFCAAKELDNLKSRISEIESAYNNLIEKSRFIEMEYVWIVKEEAMDKLNEAIFGKENK